MEYVYIALAVYVASLLKDVTLAAWVSWRTKKARKAGLQKLEDAREQIMERMAELGVGVKGEDEPAS